MGRPERRRKVHFGDTHLQRRWRTRSRKKDLDQVIKKTMQQTFIFLFTNLKNKINFRLMMT